MNTCVCVCHQELLCTIWMFPKFYSHPTRRNVYFVALQPDTYSYCFHPDGSSSENSVSQQYQLLPTFSYPAPTLAPSLKVAWITSTNKSLNRTNHTSHRASLRCKGSWEMRASYCPGGKQEQQVDTRPWFCTVTLVTGQFQYSKIPGILFSCHLTPTPLDLPSSLFAC